MKQRPNQIKGGSMSYSQNRRSKKGMSGNQSKKLKEWIKCGNTKKLIGHAKSRVQKIKKQVETSQIRRIYGPVVKIQEQLNLNKEDTQWKRELFMLKPRVIYASARQKDLEPLREDIVTFIELIENMEEEKERRKAVENFCVFIEAVVAYYK